MIIMTSTNDESIQSAQREVKGLLAEHAKHVLTAKYAIFSDVARRNALTEMETVRAIIDTCLDELHEALEIRCDNDGVHPDPR